MRENDSADMKGTGNELGEVLIYNLLEETLDAPKILSRVGLSTDALSFNSECESIHLLTLGDVSGQATYEMVFGASNIVGDIQDAIDNAIMRIEYTVPKK